MTPPLVDIQRFPWAHRNRLVCWYKRKRKPPGRVHFSRSANYNMLLKDLLPKKTPAEALAILKRLLRMKARQTGCFNRDWYKVRQAKRKKSAFEQLRVFRLQQPSRNGSKLKNNNCLLLNQHRHGLLRNWTGNATLAEIIRFCECRQAEVT